MRTWLTEAKARFGHRPELFEFVDTPYSLWSNLRDAFATAYQLPYDEATIRGIYEYARWCVQQPEGRTAEDDLGTCVAVCFYEHIPEIEQAMKDMPRWFTLQEVTHMEGILSYHVGTEGFRKILGCYPGKQRAKRRKS
jgi:hypothetical protein